MQIFDLIVFSARSTLANLESSRDQPNPLQSQCRSDFSLVDHVFHKFCRSSNFSFFYRVSKSLTFNLICVAETPLGPRLPFEVTIASTYQLFTQYSL